MVKRVPGPDRLEKGLRIGCGAVFGLLLFGIILIRFSWRTRTPSIAYIGVPAIVILFAYLGYRKGDDLYEAWRAGDLLGEGGRWFRIVFLILLAGFVIWLASASRALRP